MKVGDPLHFEESSDDDYLVVNPKPSPPERGVRYNPALATEICTAYATTTVSLERLCKTNRPRWPTFVQLYYWRVKYEDFDRAFLMAQRIRAANLMDQIPEIVDDARRDKIEVNGKTYPNPVAVQRAKIQAEFRERVAKRLDPQTWGDKLEVGHHGGGAGYLAQDDAIKLLK